MHKIERRPKVDDSHLNHPHPLIKQLYARRGVLAEQEQLHPSKLLRPDNMKGIQLAAKLVAEAIVSGKKIVIIGDFDADGATSTAVCLLALRALGCSNVDYLIPNRFDYGYGLSPELVPLAKQQGADLLLTVDNGISSIEGVEAAKQAGLQVVITDHHLPGENLPRADAIVNPNQHGCMFASKSIAGCGVAFYLMLAIRSELRQQGAFAHRPEPNLSELLDIVALGTVADVVALDANNRILVQAGLRRVRQGKCRPGITSLLEVAKRQPWKTVASDFGFAVGPRINAAGRLDEMSHGVELLISDNPLLARQLAEELDGLNAERRDIEQGMQEQALVQLQKLDLDPEQLPFGFALYQSDWHQGVIGILASRIKERYHRPVVVFANGDQGQLKGSCRSIKGVHMRDLLELLNSRHPGLIIKFGGHAMAAGLSIDASRFDEFQQAFTRVLEETVDPSLLTGIILSDGSLTGSQITLETAFAIREAGPWGQGFEEPVFDGVFTIVQQRIVGEKHLKLILDTPCGQSFDAIAFNIDLKAWPNNQATQVELAYRLDVNEFRGAQSVQLMVEQITAL